MSELQAKLFGFYGVSSTDALIEMQSEHIESLQDKLAQFNSKADKVGGAGILKIITNPVLWNDQAGEQASIVQPVNNLLSRVRNLAELGMAHGLLADDYCTQIVSAIDDNASLPVTSLRDQALDEAALACDELAKGDITYLEERGYDRSAETIRALKSQPPVISLQPLPEGLSPVYKWLERAANSGVLEVELAARIMQDYYQGADIPVSQPVPQMPKLTPGWIHDSDCALNPQTGERVPYPEQLVPGAWHPDWEHAANEWADVAVNGLQWLKNVQEGISTTDAAIENMNLGLKHCRETVDKVRSKTASQPVPEPVGICKFNYEQAKNKFFKELAFADRKRVFSIFGVSNAVLDEVRTHGDERRVFSRLFRHTSPIPQALIPQIVEALEIGRECIQYAQGISGEAQLKIDSAIAAVKQIGVA